ncbi:MAG: TonB-dependent receptor plug domain-containing protein [Gammaproteobacteria bacterium]|nr:TonB-dependent receptor plug domain-containing protein [Gammaproteobacteria bacterium]
MRIRISRGSISGSLLKTFAIQISRPFLPLMLFASFSLNAWAQENVGDDSTIVYPSAYFSEYAPVTALDMLNRIPGMEISSIGGSSRGGSSRGGSSGGSFSNVSRGGRGLGSGSSGTQILINGKRTAGKNNNTETQLRRVDADQVDYIEIIRGTSGDLDVRGSTQIANIILFEEMSNTSINYEVNANYYSDNNTEPGGSLTYAGQTGDLNFIVNASAVPNYNSTQLRENSILPGELPNDFIDEERIRDNTTYTLSTNLDYQLNTKSSLRFNALIAEDDDPTEVERLTVDLRGGSLLHDYERENIPGTKTNWEIGGDYEYRRDDGNRFKILVIANKNDTANTRERWDILENGSEEKNLFLDTGSILEERIMRGSYTMNLFNGQDVEVGAERAQTILDSNLALGLLSGSEAPSQAFGGLSPVNIPNANTRVEEVRYEPFAIHNWRISPRMSLETSLVYEASEISMSGDVSNSRDFNFFKPKLDYRFDVTPQLQLRVLIEKVVRQLSFTDFVATSDQDDEDSNTLAGNSNLRPDYWWNYNLLAEYRLPDDQGVVSANFYHHRHKDLLQRIDVSPGPNDLRSAAGNIGTGDMHVFEVKGSVRLSRLGMPNVLFTTSANVRDSWVKDSFLNETRRFNNYHRGEFNWGFRHDIPQWRLNYGIEMRNRIDGGTKRWDIEDIENDHADPYFTGFLEFIAFDDVTFRLDARNLADVQVCRDRIRYVGNIADNILEEVEYMCRDFGRSFSLKVSGTF